MPNQHCTCDHNSDIPGVEHAPSCPLVRYPIPSHEQRQHDAAYAQFRDIAYGRQGEEARDVTVDELGPEAAKALDDVMAFGRGAVLITHVDLGVDPAEIVGSRPVEVKPAVQGNAAERKAAPLVGGLLDYFPAALLAVAAVSHAANEQHNPGQPMHWERAKSGDEADALLRHLVDRGLTDTDGLRHSAKVAWRALALLQKELEADGEAPVSRASWV